MKTGIYFWFGYALDGACRMRLIKDCGFDNVTLWWGDEYELTDGQKESLPELARESGLYVENVHMPYEGANLLWQDKLEAEDIIKRYIECIRACAVHQIPVAVMHITSGFEPPAPCKLGIDRIKKITDEAERYNIALALENLKRPNYLDAVFSEIHSEKLMFCYDSGHENCYSMGSNLLEKYGDKLATLHLHDNDGTSDQHRLPGEGSVDWRTVAAKLRKKQYYKAVSLEVTNERSNVYKNVTAEEFLIAAHSKADEISRMIKEG